MKTTLEHIEPERREQLVAITELLCAEAPVEKVILFGSYARGEAVEDFVNGYVSDFDLLVVVASPEVATKSSLWSRVEQRARELAAPIPVSIIVHDIKQLNREIRTGRYFFSDILVEGVLLHDSRRMMLARPKALNPPERLAIAERDFRYWFGSATGFWSGVLYYALGGELAHAAFQLHQATERYFHAALLVFTGYKPKTHNIEELADQTAPLHERLVAAMPRSAGEDKRLFELLKRAYIEARYSRSYTITDEELEILHEQVRDLAMRVRDACGERLAAINGAEAVGPLPSAPEPMSLREIPPPPEDPQELARWRRIAPILQAARARRLLMEEGEARGLARGERKGREEGERKGREEGLREGERKGRKEGLREGEIKGQAAALVDVLRRRGLSMSEAEAGRILGCRDEAQLTRWWDRALTAATVAELLAD